LKAIRNIRQQENHDQRYINQKQPNPETAHDKPMTNMDRRHSKTKQIKKESDVLEQTFIYE
jgi:hypothetical protein